MHKENCLDELLLNDEKPIDLLGEEDDLLNDNDNPFAKAADYDLNLN